MLVPKNQNLFEDYEYDLPLRMNWANAVKASIMLEGNWRLPTIQELEGMYDRLYCSGLENFKTDTPYWSIEEEGDDFAYPFDFSYTPIFSDGKSDKFFIRSVRDVKKL